MALTATIHQFSTQLADIDRGVYETLELRMARQPSETVEYMLMRFFAYCLEYTEGIEFTEGVAAGGLPAVIIRDLTGRLTGWIEVGAPDADRLHRGSKQAERTAVYTDAPSAWSSASRRQEDPSRRRDPDLRVRAGVRHRAGGRDRPPRRRGDLDHGT